MSALMQESLLLWSLNGSVQTPLLCLPGEEKALLLGRLITSGQVLPQTPVDITAEKGLYAVTCAVQPPLSSQAWLSREALPPSASLPKIREADVASGLRLLDGAAHQSGQHTAVWRHAVTGQACVGRDIGRHNAVDKAIGRAALNGQKLQAGWLFTSGRLSLDMLIKAAAVNIPVVVTKKQVGTLALQAARQAGIAVVQAGGTPPALSIL